MAETFKEGFSKGFKTNLAKGSSKATSDTIVFILRAVAIPLVGLALLNAITGGAIGAKLKENVVRLGLSIGGGFLLGIILVSKVRL